MRNYYIFITFLTILSLILIITGLFIAGSPISQKDVQLDTAIMNNFEEIHKETSIYYSDKQQLPNSLQELKATNDNLNITDQTTKKDYTYIVTSSNSFKLCSDFKLDSKDEKSSQLYTEKKHKKGYDCISYTLSDLTSSITDTPYPPKNSVINDPHIQSVTTDANNLQQSANFPNGLFSNDTNEWGLINYDNIPVSLTISFISPVSVSSISNTFSHCPSQGGCYYVWSALGKTADGKEVDVVKETNATPGDALEFNSSSNSLTTQQLTNLTLTTTRIQGDKDDFVHWKKIHIVYSN